MIIIKDLSGTAEEAAWSDPRANLQVVCDQPAPGVIRRITLGEQGITVARGAVTVGIPLAEILKLAEAHAPLLAISKA